MTSKKKVVDPRFAKGDGYDEVIKTIEGEGKCPFCPDNFKYHKNPTLNKVGNWFITESSWPYKNSKKHFLIISKKHKEDFQELNGSDFDNMYSLVNWALKEYDLKGGGVILRFGDTAYTGATVCHLHFHLVVPELSKTVSFPIG